MKNSTIVGIATMVGVVVLGIMVSFVIARYKFRYAPLMYALFSAGLMFPMTVGITPLYLLIRNMGLSIRCWDSSCHRSRSVFPRPSSFWCRSYSRFRTNWKRRAFLMDAPALASSGAWSFRCPCLA